jgi:integrase/recombinase XerD
VSQRFSDGGSTPPASTILTIDSKVVILQKSWAFQIRSSLWYACVVLNLWRRHMKSCPHRLRTHKKCGCPIWVQGTLHGKWLKKSLDLRNWESAQKLVRDWESGHSKSAEHSSIGHACDAFIRDCEARNLSSASLGKYRLLTNELKEVFEGRSVASLAVDEVRKYRETWKIAPISAGKKLERLRTFFRFCADSEWMQGNPAKGIKAPIGHHRPTLPVTNEEFEKILWACDLFPANGIYGEGNRVRVRAFVLMLRYSGLRIRDVVLLSEDKLKNNKLLLYSAKTKVPVYVPLPDFVVKEVHRAGALRSGKYFFWSGNGEVKSCVNDWQRTLSRLAKLAGVKFHAHQLRDSFAVDLLSNGVSLEDVATLLGNTIKIAEKHYAPWVKSRQLSLEKSIKKAWKLSA